MLRDLRDHMGVAGWGSGSGRFRNAARLVGLTVAAGLCMAATSAAIGPRIQGPGYKSAEQYLNELVAEDGASVRRAHAWPMQQLGPGELSIAQVTSHDGFFYGAVAYNNQSDKDYCIRSVGTLTATTENGEIGFKTVTRESKAPGPKLLAARSYIVVYVGDFDLDFYMKDTRGARTIGLRNYVMLMVWPATNRQCPNPPRDLALWDRGTHTTHVIVQ